MYLLGVLCLVSLTVALPFSEPRAEDVAPNDPTIHTDDSAFSEPLVEDVALNDPSLDTDKAALEIDAQKGEQEEKKEEDRAEPPAELLITPTHPIEPPHREVIIELHKVDRYSEIEEPRDKIIPRDLGVAALLGSIVSAFSGAVTYGLPALISIVTKIPIVGDLLARNSPARILVVDD